MRILNLSFVLLFLLLTGCASSETNNPESIQLGKVSVFITDDLSADYSEVWVTVYKVVAEGADGEDYNLFKDDAGLVVNLTELVNENQLLSTTNLPEGTYTSFNIFLDKQLRLVTSGGDTEQREFATDKEIMKISVDGNLDVNAGAVTSFSLDFDLDGFSLNEQGQVVPFVAFIDSPGQLKRHFARVRGDVVAVGENSFTLMPKFGTEQITVTAHTVSIVVNNDVVISFDDIVVGDKVDIYGDYDATALTLIAIRIHVNDDDVDYAYNQYQEVEGVIEAIDNDVITLNIKRADFVPENDNIEVVLSNETVFIRGSRDMLAVGQQIEVKGVLENGQFAAARVHIEGVCVKTDADDQYVEVRATVTALDDTMATLQITQSENEALAIGSELQLDLSTVVIKYAMIDDIDVGMEVKIKGTMDELQNYTPVILEAPRDAIVGDRGRPVIVGSLVSYENGELVIMVTRTRNVDIAIGTEFTVDTRGVTIAAMKKFQWTSGEMIEIKGRPNQGGDFVPQLIKQAR